MGLRALRAHTGFTGPAYGTLRATGFTGPRALRAAYGTTGPTGPEGPYANLNHPLQRGSFPSTLLRWVQSWSRRLAAKACKPAWVNWAVHRLMRAAATECWRRRGACRAFARARSLTKLAASSLHLPPVSMPRTTRRHRRLRMSSGYVSTLLSASGFGQGGSCILPGPAPWLAISGEGRNYGGVNC